MEDIRCWPRPTLSSGELRGRPCDPTPPCESIDLISVSRCAAGWRVHGDLFEDLKFYAGARAERVARRLALAIAHAGRDARVSVYDAQHLLVGSFHYYAAPSWRSAERFRVATPGMAGAGL
jgi:hypothetical protein